MEENVVNKISGYCKLSRLIFPKKSDSEFIPGTWGIVEIYINKIIEGNFPYEFDDLCSIITIKGKLPLLDFSSEYYFEINPVEDLKSKNGTSFEIVFLTQRVFLTNQERQTRFLKSVLTPHQIDMLYSGLIDPFDAINSGDVKLISTVKGIGRKTAFKIIEKYNHSATDVNAFLVLREEFGLTDLAVKKLQEKFFSTDTIISKIKQNPYELMCVDGYGFKKCDALALKSGIPKNSKFRVKAFVNFFLEEIANNKGNSWIFLKDLLHGIIDFIPSLEKETFAEWLKEWTGRTQSDEEMFLCYDEEHKRIGLKRYRELEENISKEIFRILEASKKNFKRYKYTIDNAITDCERENGWEYTDEQRAAIYGCFENNISIVTGYGGSGKTNIMKPVSRFCRANDLRITQTALSGRAASNLSEVTNLEGKTIHRLLEYNPKIGFQRNKESQLNEDIVIIDEMSMNDNELLYQLLQAIPNGCKIIMLGDLAQLPPLSVGSVFKDLIETNSVPCYRLTKVHRQAQRSAIITESIKVSHGQQIIGSNEITEIKGELQDLKIVAYKDAELSRVKFLTEYRTLLQQGVSSRDIIGIVPMKLRGPMSSFSLNNDIQKFVNPDEQHLPKIQLMADKDKYYAIKLGDRVINRKNHYDTITLEVFNRFGLENDKVPVEPIYNGNLGFVTQIKHDYIVVDFKQQGEIVIKKDYWGDILLGYVVTTHSFQGSQSPYVVVGLDMSAYTLLSREMLYTQLTRAKKYCVLVGQINAIKKATSISKTSTKQTWLKELLQNFKNVDQNT